MDRNDIFNIVKVKHINVTIKYLLDEINQHTRDTTSRYLWIHKNTNGIENEFIV